MKSEHLHPGMIVRGEQFDRPFEGTVWSVDYNPAIMTWEVTIAEDGGLRKLVFHPYTDEFPAGHIAVVGGLGVTIEELGYNQFRVQAIDMKVRSGLEMMNAMQDAYGPIVLTGTKITRTGNEVPVYFDLHTKTWGELDNLRQAARGGARVADRLRHLVGRQECDR
jgi:hypothetical protein